MLDCDLFGGNEMLSSVIRSGLPFMPHFRYRKDESVCRGVLEMTHETMLRVEDAVKWKDDVIMYGYEYNPGSDTHKVYVTGPDLPECLEGGTAPFVSFDDVAKDAGDLSTIHGNYGHLDFDSLNDLIKANPKTVVPPYPRGTGTPWTTTPGTLGGGDITWTSTSSSGYLGDVSATFTSIVNDNQMVKFENGIPVLFTNEMGNKIALKPANEDDDEIET